MKTINIGGEDIPLGKFHPCLVYSEGLGSLSVHLRDCSILEVRETSALDLLYDNHPNAKKGKFVGFNLRGLHKVLGEKGYTKSSIPLEHLLERIDKYVRVGPYGARALGKHKEQLLAVAKEHQFVWHIPPNLLAR